jgi:hypothetical protein
VRPRFLQAVFWTRSEARDLAGKKGHPKKCGKNSLGSTTAGRTGTTDSVQKKSQNQDRQEARKVRSNKSTSILDEFHCRNNNKKNDHQVQNHSISFAVF